MTSSFESVETGECTADESYFDQMMSVVPEVQQPAAAPDEPVPAPPDPEQTRSRATALYRAMDGWGTDEDAIMSTLRGLSPAEVAAVRAEFQDHYGEDLDAMISGEMSDEDLAEAEALLTADPVEGVLAGLQNSLGTFNDDEAKIEDLMGSLTPEQRQQLTSRPEWEQISGDVRGNLGGTDLEVFDALAEGETATAAAIRLDEAMGASSSWYNPTAWGTDEAAVYEELGRLPPDQRAQVEAQFNARMAEMGDGSTLQDQLGEELSGADLDRAQAVLSGNTVDEQVARLAQTMEGMGTNETELFRLLEQPSLSPEQRQEIRDRYEEVHGESLDAAVIDDLSSTDEERARMAISGNGTMDPAFMMYYAMEGAGTDEALIQSTLQGMNSQQIEAMRSTWDSTYAERYGGTFDQAFEEELSGREHFDIVEIGMRGTPQTDQERAEILELQYSYERGDRSTDFGRGYMDTLDALGFSSSASQMDRQHERLQDLYDENGQLVAEPGQVESLFGQGQADMEDYRAAKDAATDALATGGEIAAAAIVTVLTDGAASPWLVAALAGAVGGATGMAIRAGVQGEAYGREAIAADTLKTALTAGFSGVMETAAVTARIAEIAGHFGDDVAREVIEAAIAGGLNNMGTGAIDGAMNGDALRGGLDEYLLSITQGAGTGLVTGVVSGGAQMQTEGMLGEVLDRTTLSGEMLTGAVSNAVGGVASTAVSPGTYDGRLEDVGLRFARAGGTGFATGGLNSAVSYHTRDRVVARDLLEGQALGDIDQAQHLSDAQREAVLERLWQSDRTVDPSIMAELAGTHTAAMETPLRRETEQTTPDIVQHHEESTEILPADFMNGPELHESTEVIPADFLNGPELYESNELVPAAFHDELQELLPVSHVESNPEHEASTEILPDFMSETGHLQSEGGDLLAYREELVLQELIRLEDGGSTGLTDQVLAASGNIDEMEAMLLRASGGGGRSDLAEIDATTQAGAAEVLLTSGIPQSQLDNLAPETLDAMARYSQAYSSGDLEAAAAAHTQMSGGLNEGMLALVEGSLIAHHYGMEGAEHVGLESSVRAGELLSGEIQATDAEMDGMQSFLGARYDEYLEAVQGKVPADDPRWSMLSEAEMVAVYGYTTSDYQMMNGALRTLQPGQLQELMPYLATAQSGLGKLPSLGDLQGETTTQRGLESLPDFLSDQLQVGMTYTDNAFMSTSMTDTPLDLFSGGANMTIIGSSGVPVSDMSAYGTEQEALYPAGTSFTVLERYTDEAGAIHITLQEQ